MCDANSLRILAVNNAACARYGYTLKEFRIMTVRDLRPRSDFSAFDSVLLLDHDAPGRSLWRHVDKAGVEFPVELSAVRFERPRRKMLLISASDASGWSAERQQLALSEETHRSVVEECPFGIFRSALNTGSFLQANPSMLRLIGCNLEDLANLHAHELYCEPSDRERMLDEIFSSGSIHDFQLRMRRIDGSTLLVSISGYLCIDAKSREQCLQGYVVDTTREHELGDRLNQSRRIESVGRLAGGVAHDFNNITQSISLSCELALQSQLSLAVESKLKEILRQTARAAQITQQLLAFSRRQVLQPRIVNLNECVRQAAPMMARATGPIVNLELKLDEAAEPVLMDPEQLTIVLVHLADNARTAMPEGGTLSIATGASGFRGPSPCRYAVLSVTDNGIGMDRATLQRIFEPFFSTKDAPLGTGLGLSTVHGIVTQSKGRIECKSAPGCGTTFSLYLPIALQERPVAEHESPSPDCGGSHLLIAEDDPLVNKHLSQALREAGYTVDAVNDGQEALLALERNEYSLLISDVIMPRLGGLELTRRLRQRLPLMPVLLISGYSQQVSIMQQVPPGRIAYLQKPFSCAKLIAAVHDLLAPAIAPPKEEVELAPQMWD